MRQITWSNNVESQDVGIKKSVQQENVHGENVQKENPQQEDVLKEDAW